MKFLVYKTVIFLVAQYKLIRNTDQFLFGVKSNNNDMQYRSSLLCILMKLKCFDTDNTNT